MVTDFKNESLADFSRPETVRQMQEALEYVKSQLGAEYPLIIGEERIKTKDKIRRLPVIKKESQYFHSEGIKLGTLDFSQKGQGAFLEMPLALSDTASSKVQEIRRLGSRSF